MSDDFNIPESNRIGSMMNDLFAGELPSSRPSAPSSGRRLTPPRLAPRRRRRLAPVSLGQFAEGVNWANASGYESPLLPPKEIKLGSFTLTAFAAGVNWHNASDAPGLLRTESPRVATRSQTASTQQSVDSFLSEFSWD